MRIFRGVYCLRLRSGLPHFCCSTPLLSSGQSLLPLPPLPSISTVSSKSQNPALPILPSPQLNLRLDSRMSLSRRWLSRPSIQTPHSAWSSAVDKAAGSPRSLPVAPHILIDTLLLMLTFLLSSSRLHGLSELVYPRPASPNSTDFKATVRVLLLRRLPRPNRSHGIGPTQSTPACAVAFAITLLGIICTLPSHAIPQFASRYIVPNAPSCLNRSLTLILTPSPPNCCCSVFSHVTGGSVIPSRIERIAVSPDACNRDSHLTELYSYSPSLCQALQHLTRPALSI